MQRLLSLESAHHNPASADASPLTNIVVSQSGEVVDSIRKMRDFMLTMNENINSLFDRYDLMANRAEVDCAL